MKIFLVRHGQTNWNIENRLQGCVDIPLNSTGIKQAHILANNIEDLNYDLIISSPLGRALETAKIINKKSAPLITDPSLKERNFGFLEGVFGTDYDKNLYWDYNKNYKNKDVEPIQEFFDRVHSFLKNLCQKYPDKNILIVTHNGVNIATNCYFNGFPHNMDLLGITLDNCSYVEYDSTKIIAHEKTDELR